MEEVLIRPEHTTCKNLSTPSHNDEVLEEERDIRRKKPGRAHGAAVRKVNIYSNSATRAGNANDFHAGITLGQVILLPSC